jgi:hypothetical protein
MYGADDLPHYMFDWSTNMARSLIHGRAAQREKTLAEAHDYIPAQYKVNDYFWVVVAQ